MSTEQTAGRLSTDDLARPDAGAEDVRTPEETGAAGDRIEEAVAPAPGAEPTPLVDGSDDDGFRRRWEGIQAGFVDEPRHAVEQADALVAELMQRLAESFSNERRSLEGQWDRGEEVSTEDLRVALTRYRSFFDRLLAH